MFFSPTDVLWHFDIKRVVNYFFGSRLAILPIAAAFTFVHAIFPDGIQGAGLKNPDICNLLVLKK